MMLDLGKPGKALGKRCDSERFLALCLHFNAEMK